MIVDSGFAYAIRYINHSFIHSFTYINQACTKLIFLKVRKFARLKETF